MSEICSACLSGDRNLIPVKSLRHIFNSINWLDVEFDIDEDSICWECEAIIAKIQRFKNQVLGAQEALRLCREIARPVTTLKSYSKLSAVCKDNYDVVVVEEIKEEKNEHEEESADIEESSETNNIEMVEIEYYDTDKEDIILDDTSDGGYNEQTELLNKVKKRNDKKNQGENCDFAKLSKNEMKFAVTKMTLEELEAARESDRKLLKYRPYRNTCEKCIIGYYDENKYKNHLEEKHSPKSGRYKCLICEVRFNRMMSMKHHYDCHFRRYHCRLCDYTHHKLNAMTQHNSRKHEKDKKYQCNSCDKVFELASRLRYHRDTMHRERPKCEVCNKSFTSKETLKTHNIFMHSCSERVPVLRCGSCGRACRGRAALRSHARTHAPPATDHAYCAECGVQFKSQMLYQRHLLMHRRHRTVDVLKFSCSHCDAKFVCRSSLQRHVAAVHLKKYTFTCEICNRGFMRKDRLKDHVMEIHEGISRPKDKVCSYCGKGFKDRQVLVMHVRTHTGERPHRCPRCGRAFAQRGALNTHMRALHPTITHRGGGGE